MTKFQDFSRLEKLSPFFQVSRSCGNPALKWFQSYLEERYMKVCIGNSYSNLGKLMFSVPQGSCGEPVLFNCCSSAIATAISDGLDIGGFTDDHTLKIAFKPDRDHEGERQCISKMESCLLNVATWMDQTRLKMNPSKTEFIVFGGWM